MNKQTYECNWRVRHDLTLYVAGDFLSLTKDEARPLLASGAVKLSDIQPKPEASGHSEAADQASLVQAAIAKLEQGNEAHWTNGGKPECGALTELCGFTVSAALRDQVWAQVSEAAQ